MIEQVRAVELTADAAGRTVRIDPGDRTFLMGRLVRIRHKLVSVGFSAIGVVDRL